MPIYSINDSKKKKTKFCTTYRLLFTIIFMLLLVFFGAIGAQWIGAGNRGFLSSLGFGGNGAPNQQWQQPQNAGVLDDLLGSLGMAQNNNQLIQPQQPWQPEHRGITQNGLMNDLSRLLHQGDPGHQQWEEHARHFCGKYPTHQKCVDGKIPEFREIEGMLANIGRSVQSLVPQIPRITLNNPLNGVPFDLASLINNSFMGIGEINLNAIQSIQGVCQRIDCNERKSTYIESRSFVREKILNFEKIVYGKDTSNELDLRLERTRQVKQALIDRANLQGVVTPADDGVFDKDILLTTEQADFMLNELGKGGDGMRKKRSSLFFEQEYVKKWDTSKPIQYTFHESLEEWDKNDVRMGIAEITRNVECIKFEFLESVPRGPHLHFMKIENSNFCGLSYTGRLETGNPIYLSFACGNQRGIAIHEIMHALGVAHQHLRTDRDDWIEIDWTNINPQHYDMFVVSDARMFTTYGIAYDYKSIMHYNAYTAAVDTGKPTMKPRKDETQNIRFLGQRDQMSSRDVELLKKMYCKSESCWDTNVFCGSWALKNLCRSQRSSQWMQQNCRKSCNIC